MVDPRDKKRADAAKREKARREQVEERAKADRAKKKANRAAKVQDKATKRPRHTDTDYEELLCEAEARGWLVFKDDGYFKCWCPCAEKHFNTVVLTPSKQRTLINTRARFRGLNCWKEG